MQPEPDILFFDGVCNLCNGLVKFIIRHDRKGTVMFSSLQSEAASKFLSRYSFNGKIPDSVIFLSGNRIYLKSSAILQLLKVTGGLLRLFYIFRIVPRFIRDFVYDFVARNRYRVFGKRNECMIPGPDVRKRFLS
ncbi:MAG TPA: thiol-disulfide oxidoreductase DCC family protein [Bacteroidales bacterium]|nr:thiol-disulfide oxidoreductase DCC family protein [Bacteroidales bacterium]